jgi:hypothetical protein
VCVGSEFQVECWVRRQSRSFVAVGVNKVAVDVSNWTAMRQTRLDLKGPTCHAERTLEAATFPDVCGTFTSAFHKHHVHCLYPILPVLDL